MHLEGVGRAVRDEVYELGWVCSVGGVRDGIAVAQALNCLCEVKDIKGGD